MSIINSFAGGQAASIPAGYFPFLLVVDEVRGNYTNKFYYENDEKTKFVMCVKDDNYWDFCFIPMKDVTLNISNCNEMPTYTFKKGVKYKALYQYPYAKFYENETLLFSSNIDIYNLECEIV